MSDVLFSFLIIQNNQEDQYTRTSCKRFNPMWPLGGSVGPQKTVGAAIDADQGGDD